MAISPDQVPQLVARRRPGYSLPQEFYCDPEIFELDLDRIFRRFWIPVGPLARIPEEGQWFTFNLASDSIIIARGRGGAVHAMHNVCRHRGSSVCYGEEGRGKALVCPYHGWVYDLEGSLLSAQAMGETFDPSEFGLKKVPVMVVHGTVMIYLGKGPPTDLSEACQAVDTFLDIFDLNRARLAARIRWEIDANWKLVAENFTECYHCGSNHPEYCSVMEFALPRTTGEPGQTRAFEEQTRTWEAKARALGHPVGSVGGTEQVLYVGLRVPIGSGRLSQTQGGRPAAPLMGRFKESDGGMTAARIHPCNYWQNSCDHAVTFRFTPIGPQKTLQEVCWLVHPDAVAGRDYRVEDLTWMWKATTDEDKRIIDYNQRGVNSSAYVPGPYATIENGVNTFVNWYLAQL